MKFLCDVPIARATIERLRQLGHDCISVREVLSAKAPDPTIVRAARDEDRIIISFDLDFAALVALSRQTCPSVITLRLSIRSAEYVNQRLTSRYAKSKSTAVVDSLQSSRTTG